MSQININAQQFSFITNNLNCDHNSFTFCSLVSFMLTFCIIHLMLCCCCCCFYDYYNFFTTKHVPLVRERDVFFSDHEREIEKKFW